MTKCVIGFCQAVPIGEPDFCTPHAAAWLGSLESRRRGSSQAQLAARVDFVQRVELEHLNGHPAGALECPCPTVQPRDGRPSR